MLYNSEKPARREMCVIEAVGGQNSGGPIPMSAPAWPGVVLVWFLVIYVVGCIVTVSLREDQAATISILCAGSIVALGFHLLATMATTGLWL